MKSIFETLGGFKNIQEETNSKLHDEELNQNDGHHGERAITREVNEGILASTSQIMRY